MHSDRSDQKLSADRLIPIPLAALGIAALLAALWAGLVRLGWGSPSLVPTLPMNHGPLMVSGFLGTVIGVERAVALTATLPAGEPRRWTFLAPILSALGGLALFAGVPGRAGALLLTGGSVALVVVFARILRMHLAPYTVTMAAGALMWMIGSVLWLTGTPVHAVAWWWAGFLVLTVAGERIELGRALGHARTSTLLFAAAAGLLFIGAVAMEVNAQVGARLAGVAVFGLAAWLLRYDIARKTIRRSGLTRFIAACLLTGYVWLGIGGLLAVRYGAVIAGPQYDAILHAVFVGFVLSMIFGHAPLVFPAITGRMFAYRPTFYVHLALLHASLALRVVGDLAGWLPGRQCGGLLNVVAVLVFLASTAIAMRKA